MLNNSLSLHELNIGSNDLLADINSLNSSNDSLGNYSTAASQTFLDSNTTDEAIEEVQYYLSELSDNANFNSQLQLVFGEDYNEDTLNNLFTDFGNGNFSNLPDITIVSGATIDNSHGTYNSLEQSIYLSEEFVIDYQDNVDVVSGVILEEIGHFIDSQVNEFDAIGDKGELFSSIVRETVLSSSNIVRIQSEDDFNATVLEQQLEVESFLPSATEIDFEILQNILPDSLGDILTEELLTVGNNGETIITWSNNIQIDNLLDSEEYLPELIINSLTLTIPNQEDIYSYELLGEVTIGGESYTVRSSLKAAEGVDNNQLDWDEFVIENINTEVLLSWLSPELPSLAEIIPDSINSLGLAFGKNSLKVTYNDTTNLISWLEDAPLLNRVNDYFPEIVLQNSTIEIADNEESDRYSLTAEVTIGDDTVSLAGSFSDSILDRFTLESSSLNVAVDDWFSNISLINDTFPTVGISQPKLTIGSEDEIIFSWGNIYNISQLFQDAITPLNLPANLVDNLLGNIEISNNQIAFFPDSDRIQYYGSVNDNVLEAIYDGDDFNLSYELGENFSLGDWFADFPVINEIDLTNPQLLLANDPFIDPDTGNYISEGLNFSGTFLDFATSESQYLSWINDWLGIETLDINFGYEPSGNSSLSGRINTDISLIDTDNFDATLEGAGLEFSFDGGEPSFAVKGDLNVRIDDEDLNFTGGLALEPESVTGFFSLQADEDGWSEPFGLPDSEIRNLAFQMGVTYAPPFIDNLGIIGDLQFGNYDINSAVLLDINDPDNFALIATPNEPLQFIDVLLGPVSSYAFSQAADNISFVEDFRGVLDNIFDVQIQAYDIDGDLEIDPLIQIVPFPGVEIADIPLEEGFSLNAGLNAWGQTGSVYVKANSESEVVEGNLSLDRIDLGGILVLEGNNDSQINLDLMLSPTEQFLEGDVSVRFLGQQLAGIELKAGQNGLEFDLDGNLGFMSTSLDVVVDDNGFDVNGDLDLNLDLEIPTSIGTINLVDMGLSAETSLTLDDNVFTGSIDGSFEFWGETLETGTLNVNSADLEDLYSLLEEAVRQKIESSFNSIFNTFDRWVDAIANGVISFTGNAIDFATIAIDNFGASIANTAQALWDRALVSDSYELASVLWSQTSATLADVANALYSAADRTLGGIIADITQGAGLSFTSAAQALWDSALVSDSYELASVLWSQTSATLADVANALYSAADRTLGGIIADITQGAGLSFTNAAQALWDSALVSGSYELASVLWSQTSAGVVDIGMALRDAVGRNAREIVADLVNGAGLSFYDAGLALWNIGGVISNSDDLISALWNQGAGFDDLVSVLSNIVGFSYATAVATVNSFLGIGGGGGWWNF